MAMAASMTLHAQDFDAHFEDATLRIDYTLMGNATEQHVALRDMSSTNNWWGRRVNLDNVPLEGNGDLTLYDAETREVIYKTSFSSLFQEWITTAEAATSTTAIVIELSQPDSSSALSPIALLAQTKAVRCTFTGTTLAGGGLSPDQYLSADLTVVLDNGITVDLDSLIGSDEENNE
jgi:hypothetical protein